MRKTIDINLPTPLSTEMDTTGAINLEDLIAHLPITMQCSQTQDQHPSNIVYKPFVCIFLLSQYNPSRLFTLSRGCEKEWNVDREQLDNVIVHVIPQ